MSYFAKWTDVEDGVSMLAGFKFETPEQAAEWIKREILSDFNKGISGAYVYQIVKEGE